VTDDRLPRTRRWLLWLLSAYLMVWCTVSFAIELAAVLPTVGLRGPAAGFELAAHGGAAVLAFAAGRALRTSGVEAIPLARAGVITWSVVQIQSLYWTALPTQTRPGDELPLAILAAAFAGAWLLYLRRLSRVSRGVRSCISTSRC
jgi:hypothetical protein